MLIYEKMENLKDNLLLVEKANEKVKGNAKNRKIIKSPLKVLKFVLKSNKYRPLWTLTTSTNTGFLRHLRDVLLHKIP